MKTLNKIILPFFTVIILFLISCSNWAQTEIPTILGSINEKKIKNYSYNFYRYSRNEIFARLGYSFKNKELDLYFSAQPWYKKNINTTISLTENQKKIVKLFQSLEKQNSNKKNKSMLLAGYPVFLVDKEAYLLPKEFSWALRITTLPKEYIAFKAIDKIVSERPFKKLKGINLLVAYDYVGSDIESCVLLGAENGKFNYLFSKEGYSLKASINSKKEILISGTRKSYLCGIFITSFEYLYSPKTKKGKLLPTKQQVITTSNQISYALEIENKEAAPYKIVLPVNTDVTITKYINKPNCYFIESKLGKGWVYPKRVETDEEGFDISNLCEHFYRAG